MAMASGEEVKLYGTWGSPFSHRVEMALKLKGIQYEYIKEDLANKSLALLHYNPVHQKVPVLVHNGKPIAESLVILEYIDQSWKANPILPLDPYDRAMARFWAKFHDEKCVYSLWKTIQSVGEEREKAVEEAHQNVKTLEDQLKDKRFFGGDSIGFLDIAASFIAHWSILLQEVVGDKLITEDKYPILFKWAGDFKACPAIQQCLPAEDELCARFRARSGDSQ